MGNNSGNSLAICMCAVVCTLSACSTQDSDTKNYDKTVEGIVSDWTGYEPPLPDSSEGFHSLLEINALDKLESDLQIAIERNELSPRDTEIAKTLLRDIEIARKLLKTKIELDKLQGTDEQSMAVGSVVNRLIYFEKTLNNYGKKIQYK